MLKMGSININGTSRIGNADAVYFNASFSDNNESFTENITNHALYADNQAQCDSDYDAFKAAAREAVTQMNMGGENGEEV